jgi:hypothetical protein
VKFQEISGGISEIPMEVSRNGGGVAPVATNRAPVEHEGGLVLTGQAQASW